MPWTPKQVKKLLSSGSPLKPAQKLAMKAELHAEPALGHARKARRTATAARVPNRNALRSRLGL